MLRLRALWSWIYPALIGVAIALGLRTWVVGTAIVPSGSMRPMIPDPCRIVVSKISTEFAGVHRGEIVVFHAPDDPKELYVKRIIGMPGDTITVNEHQVLVNGKPYVVSDAVQPNGKTGTYVVPAGHYFMMGDNRPISDDSRYWSNKYVARSAIVGQAVFVLFPIGKIKVLS